MTVITVNRGKPAATKVVEVAPAVPPTITLTISVEQAPQLAALAGQVAVSQGLGIFDPLSRVLKDLGVRQAEVVNSHLIPPIKFTQEA